MKTYHKWKTYNQWQSGVKFKYPFEGCETISETHSQAYQDIFVLTLLNGKRNGEYFEIGCNLPDYTNNTFLLAKDFGWTGTSIDFLTYLESEWKRLRPKNRFVICDALTVNYEELIGKSRTIDYLQLDIEPCMNTLSALMRIPHNLYRFAVISFETDVYLGQNGPYVREKSREFLSNLGYTLIIPDVIVDETNPYEDWWVDLNLVDSSIALSIQTESKTTTHPFKLLLKY